MGFKSIVNHSTFANPAVSLGFTALSLLLLVLVLLSVPGPINGLYWFSVENEHVGGKMSAGVLGWCMSGTANCTYSPLSENHYLSSMINTGEALTVRIMLPLACYWMIVTLVAWVVLSATTSVGYKIKDLDSITRHLRFAVIEACVLCISLFGNVLCWMAFGLGRQAYMSVQNGGGNPSSGNAMETTGVAAMIGLLSLFFAVWGLHLRMKSAQSQWKEEAVMVRRRSMALTNNRLSMMASINAANNFPSSNADNGHLNVEETMVDDNTSSYDQKTRWSDSPDGYYPSSNNLAHVGRRVSIIKDAKDLEGMGEEERLDASINQAKRNSRDQAMMINRASYVLE